ncbi:hypothetical protein BGZ70_001027, partial [Mortierella alpina]
RVRTTTPQAPLVVGASSKEVFHHFIADLSADTTYELGLRGVAIAKLDLGPFGNITVENIPLDIKTSVEGLQGLRHIQYISLLSLTSGELIKVSSLINIHNPSQLTLYLGELIFQANMFNYTDETLLGVSRNLNLRLVPGANVVPAQFELNLTYPAATQMTALLLTQDISKIPALHAGLAKVRTSVVIPQLLPLGFTQNPYSHVWHLKVLSTTVDDGLIEMTQTIHNVYPGTTMRIVKGANETSDLDSNALSVYLASDHETPLAQFQPEMTVELNANASKMISFKMRLRDEFTREKTFGRGVLCKAEWSKTQGGLVAYACLWSSRSDRLHHGLVKRGFADNDAVHASDRTRLAVAQGLL